VTGAVEIARALREHERDAPAARAAARQRRLQTLVAHARERSRFYRARIAPGPVELAALPTLDKATLVERFEDIACGSGDRSLVTSGSSGRPGRFIYDEDGWATYVAQFLRVTAMAGRPLWEHPGVRIGVVSAAGPMHASAQIAMMCVALGLGRLQPLPVTLGLERIVAGLNEQQPEWLHAYASYAALLAAEQRAGRLRIAPRIVTTSSELLTAEMAARVREAFGVRPFDFYATTEGLWAAECEAHAGLHVFEDLCVLENVGEDGHAVPDGEPGARLLVTNLFNRAQPLIRYELEDVVTLDPDPCPCGRTLRRIRSVHGRGTELLSLDGVTVHPLQFAALAADPGVSEFQVVQHGAGLTVRIVPADDADVPAVTGRLIEQIGTGLRELGLANPRLTVEPCAAIERPPSGKLELVVSDASQRHARSSGGR
jgi:phenylacetate-CoA ligase